MRNDGRKCRLLVSTIRSVKKEEVKASTFFMTGSDIEFIVVGVPFLKLTPTASTKIHESEMDALILR